MRRALLLPLVCLWACFSPGDAIDLDEGDAATQSEGRGDEGNGEREGGGADGGTTTATTSSTTRGPTGGATSTTSTSGATTGPDTGSSSTDALTETGTGPDDGTTVDVSAGMTGMMSTDGGTTGDMTVTSGRTTTGTSGTDSGSTGTSTSGTSTTGTSTTGTSSSGTGTSTTGTSTTGTSSSSTGTSTMGTLSSSTSTSTSTTGSSTTGVPPGPDVFFVSSSVGEGEDTDQSDCLFVFGSTDPNATFECRFDNVGGTWASCGGSSYSQDLLRPGPHSMEVRALDLASTPGDPIIRNWTISAMPTTIEDIRLGFVTADTLVNLSTNVQVTAGIDDETLFIQEAGGNALTDVRNHGIMVLAASDASGVTPGDSVIVTGTVKTRNGNTAVENADLILGTPTALYQAPWTRDGFEVQDEALEGVRIRFGAEHPSFNCSGGCSMSSGVCLEGCDSCGPQSKVAWVNLSGQSMFEWATYTGVLVGRSASELELWILDIVEGGDDICL